MVGLPIVVTAGIPLYFYPLEDGNWADQNHHIVLLAATAWLLTVGPSNPYADVKQVSDDKDKKKK